MDFLVRAGINVLAWVDRQVCVCACVCECASECVCTCVSSVHGGINVGASEGQLYTGGTATNHTGRDI